MVQKFAISFVLILVFAGFGAGAGVIWPYQRAIFGEHRYQRESGRETILTETNDDIARRALFGSVIGGGFAAAVLVFRTASGGRGA